MSNTPQPLERIPFYTVELNNPTPPVITSRPPRTQQTQGTQIQGNNGNWYSVIPGALEGVANIADVFWGQPDNYTTINNQESDNTMTIIIVLIIAVVALYFLLKS